MKLRSYSNSDWEAIREIYNLSKHDEMRGSVDARAVIPLEHDHKMIQLFKASDLIVMEENGKVIGFSGNKGNHISCLFVHPEHRRKGVAVSLIREILGKLEGAITLHVARNNGPAKRLYQGFGFTVEKEFTGNLNGYEFQAMVMFLAKKRSEKLYLIRGNI